MLKANSRFYVVFFGTVSRLLVDFSVKLHSGVNISACVDL